MNSTISPLDESRHALEQRAPANGAGRRASPTPPRSSRSAPPSACRRRSRSPKRSVEQVVERALLEVARRQPGEERRRGRAGARPPSARRPRDAGASPRAPARRARRGGCGRGGRRPGRCGTRACGCPASGRAGACRRENERDRHPLRDLRLGHERARAAAARRGSPRARARRAPRARSGARRRGRRRAGARTGSRRPTSSVSISSSTWSRISRCFVIAPDVAASSAGAAPAPGQRRRASRPSRGSKKWSRSGSTASSRRSPTRADVRASTRAVKSAPLVREHRLGLVAGLEHLGGDRRARRP